MKRLRLIIFCIIAIGGVSLHGQTHDYRIFTRADGLAATECASVTCDAFGQIWVGSNTGGMAVYNGKQWRQLVDTAAKSLLGYLMPIHKTAEGDSTLFFFNSDAGKGMILIRDGQIRHYPIKDYPILKEANFPISGFSDGRIWGLNGDGIVFQFDRKSDNFIEIGRIPLEKTRDLWLLDYNTLTKTFLRHIRNDSVYALQTGTIGGKWTTILSTDNILKPTIDAYMASKGQVFAFKNNEIQRFDGQYWRTVPLPLATQNIPAPIVYHKYQNGRFFLVLKKDATRRQLFELDDDFKVLKTVIFPSRSSISDVNKDHAGNFWIATMEGLIKVTPSFLNLFSRETESMVADLHALAEEKNGRMWFGSYSEGLATFDGEQIIKNPKGTNPIWRLLPGSLRLPDGRLLMFPEKLDGGVLIFDGQKWTENIKQRFFFFVTTLADGRVALGGGGGNGLALQKKSGGAIRDTTDFQWITSKKGMQLFNVLGIAEDRLGRIWMGRTSQGIAVYDRQRDTAFTWLIQNANTDFGAITLTADKRGNVWFGTKKGIFLYETPTDSLARTPQYFNQFNPFRDLKPIAKDILIAIGEVHSLKIWRNKYLIVGGSYGFMLLDLEQFYASKGKRFPIFKFDDKNGFSGGATEQNAVWIDRNDNIWLGHDKGATRFDIKNFPFDTTLYPLSIDSISDRNEAFSLKNTTNNAIIRLNSGEQSVKIQLSTPFNPLLTNDFLIKYRLVGKTEWSALLTPDLIELPLLAPATYTLEVVGVKNGLEGTPQYLTFRIPKIWYKNEWYWLIFLFATGALGFWLYRKQEQRKRAFIQLRVQAIANQLNPHFINNALNMIQLKSRDNADAVDIIDRLSQNIQTVFRNTRSRKSYHTLAEELQLVSNYLHIQKYRFGNNLDFELPDNKNITPFKDINIPLMSLQIHCENAVEHGIRNQKQGGKVTIRLEAYQNTHIHILIEDNGIGRKKAADIGSKGNQQGVQMLLDMADITNKFNRDAISYRYEDGIFTDTEGSYFGTRVHLFFPKTYNYDPPE